MKKIFLTAAACFCASMFMSCNSSIGNILGTEEKLDTVSYVMGMSIAKQIEEGIMPQLKADYDVIIETIEESFDGKKSFKVGDVEITKENLQELGMKYLGPAIGPKVQAAMADTTGMTEVFDNETDKKIASTILGVDIASGTENAPFEIKPKSFMNAIKDVHNKTQIMTDEEAEEYFTNYFTVVLPAENARLSKEWLAGIEKEDGVKKTESGILYKIIEEGDMSAKAVNDTDVVKVLYTGKTRKDKVFDSNRWNDMPEQRKKMIETYQPDQACDNPIEFPLNRVIPGWTEGMKLVGKGGRIILWIPSELAYGENGAGQDIGANEALCFDVELLDVTAAE
jgi:FKBP-type peptidyl-prolyl cis-trans isomerase FkpA